MTTTNFRQALNNMESIKLHTALDEAYGWAIKSKGRYAGYALTYLYDIPTAIEEYGERGLKMQLEYLLSNLIGWKGDIAKKSKAAIKEYATARYNINREPIIEECTEGCTTYSTHCEYNHS